ncbi:hypothetical protein BX600DRAFT_378117 [Xylariales sp. PMI_506]|nr:hypothetical protein BX600DRAFT_378117 [Xylariales sp. PMI_506]
MLNIHPDHVDLLILGAGWTSTFLIPLLGREGITHAATTTDGRDRTIPFKFDPNSDDEEPYRKLPRADTVVITFPLKGEGQSERLVKLYRSTHPEDAAAAAPAPTNFVQLGATSIWKEPTWQDDNSAYNAADPRAVAEDELMRVAGAAVLNLAGLYGGARQPRDWVDRVVRSKEELRGKGSLHLIHGDDVARAIVALHRDFTPSKRWLLCDLHVYDWWDLLQGWAARALHEASVEQQQKQQVADGATSRDSVATEKPTAHLRWVGELMEEEGVKALPRDTALLGRKLDGRAFWNRMGIWPIRGRIL